MKRGKKNRGQLGRGLDYFGSDSGSGAAGLDTAKHQIAVSKAPTLNPKPVLKDSGFYGSDSAAAPEANSVAPEAVDPTPASTPTAKPAGMDSSEPAASDKLVVTRSELAAIVAQQASQLVDQAHAGLIAQQQATNQQMEADRRRAEADRAVLQKVADDAAAEVTRLKGIFTATGTSIPTAGNGGDADSVKTYGRGINVLNFPRTKEIGGAAKDFVDMLGNPQYCPQIAQFDSEEGYVFQRNTHIVDSYLRDPKFRSEVMRDMDLYMKAHGFLRGVGRDAGNPGPTRNVPGSIPDHFLDVLSAMARTTHTHRYVWWQFPIRKLDVGQMPGQTVRIKRFDWLNAPTNLDDYVLDDGATVATFNTTSQGLRSTSVGIAVKTYGIGRGTTTDNRVLSITDLVTSSRLENFMAIAEACLLQHWRGVEDLGIRRIFRQAVVPQNIYYNDSGSLTQDPLTILGGNDGTLTEDVLSDLSAEMSTRMIPTFPNGKRAGVLTPKSVANLTKSMGDKLRASTDTEIETIMNVMNSGSLGDGIQQLTGYVGTVGGFMLFESTELSIGMPGETGVSLLTTGNGSHLFRDNFFFGPGVCGHAESSPFEVVEDSAGTFGTRHNLIWKETGDWGALDCSEHLGSGQQTRVVVLRTADRPI